MISTFDARVPFGLTSIPALRTFNHPFITQMTRPLRNIRSLDKNLHLRSHDQAERWQDGIYIGDEEELPDNQLSLAARLPWFFYGLLALVAIGVFWRLYHIQFTTAGYYNDLSLGNHTRVFYERAVRGIVYDRAGRALVENKPRNDLAIVPADFPRAQELRQKLLVELGQVLKIDSAVIETQLQEFAYIFQPIVIKEDIDHETLLALKSRFEGKDGVMVLENFYRYYPWGSDLAHILGYVGKISGEELAKHNQASGASTAASAGAGTGADQASAYSRQSYIGKVGVEFGAESSLRGQDRERRLIVDAHGRLSQDQSRVGVTNGSDVALTVDAGLQNQARQALLAGLRRSGSKAGAAVVMDPRNGEVLSLVSLPDYDNNLFARGISGEQAVKKYQALINDQTRPLLNRAVGGLYPPGSVFKLVSAVGVLADNIVGPKDRISAPSQITLEHSYDQNVEFVFPDWKATGHGQINIVTALAESADTFFYQVVGGYKDLVGLGLERLALYAGKLGVGTSFGLEIPGENPGVFPSNDWKRQRLGESWYQGDTYHVAIGQGYLLVNPLQVAAYTAAIANGGTLYQPHLIKSVVNPAGERRDKAPVVLQDKMAPDWVFDRVQEGMRLAVTSPQGTAKALQALSVRAAGKTGTAQYSNNEKEHAWFTAFAPYDQPEIVVTVLVEGGGEGGIAALPVAREILSYYFARK